MSLSLYAETLLYIPGKLEPSAGNTITPQCPTLQTHLLLLALSSSCLPQKTNQQQQQNKKKEGRDNDRNRDIE